MRKKLKKIILGSGTGSVVRVSIMGIVMAAIIVSFYYQLSHRLSAGEEGGEAMDELKICMTQDFISNYPESPREVVKWHNRITKLFYSGELSNKEVENLCDQMICLMDKELISDNPRDILIASTKQDIERYKVRDKKIVSTDVGSNDDIKYTTAANGDDLAYVTSYYFVQEASKYVSTYQTYCLRRDGNGRYKILAFELTDENGNPI